MRKEITQLIEDIKKVQEAQVLLSRVGTVKLDSEINKLIDYALIHKIIKSSLDIVDICLSFPEIKEIICNQYDNFIENKMKKLEDARQSAQKQYDRRYAGSYNSLSDVPGYGTEWNERCIPDGVTVRNRNSRC